MTDYMHGGGINMPFLNWPQEHLFSGAHKIPAGAAFPASPEEGQWFYRTDWERVCVYSGGVWLPAENLYRNVKGIGGTTGKRIVFADQYPGADMVTKIMAAATDVGAGGVVMIPAGVHADCVEFNPASGVWYLGAARGNDDVYTGATEIRFAAGAAYGLNAVSKSNFKIENITFRGYQTGGLPSTHYSRIYNCTNAIFRNVQWGYFISLYITSGCIGLRFYDCQSFKTYYAGVMVDATGLGNMMQNCSFTAIGRHNPSNYAGIRFYSGSQHWMLLNCNTQDWDANYRAGYGFQVSATATGIRIEGGKWYGAIDDWIDAGTDTYINAYHS